MVWCGYIGKIREYSVIINIPAVPVQSPACTLAGNRVGMKDEVMYTDCGIGLDGCGPSSTNCEDVMHEILEHEL